MWLSKKTYHIGGGCSQTVVRLFNYPIILNKSPYSRSIRFGSPGVGLTVTTNPLFSVRYGYTKSLKLGKYYIVKL
jgi:hypothetical protein